MYIYIYLFIYLYVYIYIYIYIEDGMYKVCLCTHGMKVCLQVCTYVGNEPGQEWTCRNLVEVLR